MLDVLIDALIDTVKLLPFLLLTYAAMEYLEHRMSGRMQAHIRSAGKAGPAIGGLLGALPQCGFSTAASNLYAGRVITMGTLVAIYLSTSDEMLPILLSEGAPLPTILKILGAKVLIGMVAGFAIDLLHIGGSGTQEEIHEICEHEHCHCEEGHVWKSALWHTLQISGFILLTNLIIGTLLFVVGEDAISNLLQGSAVVGPLVAALVGLIPNCAGSVVITQLYLDGILPVGSMMAGLLAGSGVGLLVLFRVNRHNMKENFLILGLQYAIGVVVGVIIGLVL